MRIGVIGDTHLPFVHPNYLKFCRDTFKAWSVEHVIHIGDVVDNAALSFYEHNPDGPSAGDELEAARESVKPWYKQWPEMDVCIGNHCCRFMRVAHKAGIPAAYLRDYGDVYNTPRWNWSLSHTYDGVLYEHGTGMSGKYAALNAAIQKRTSLVIGHLHTFSGVTYHVNDTSRIFGAQVGSGVDVKALVFEYQKNFPIRPVLSCAIIIDGSLAVVEPMPIGDGEEYER
jgi:predicted phosphodiesterase